MHLHSRHSPIEPICLTKHKPIETTPKMRHILFTVFILFASSFASLDAQITAPFTPQTVAANPDAKYLAPIPEENGKVYLLREVQLPASMNAEEAFNKLKFWYNRCMQDSRIINLIEIPTTSALTLQNQVIQTITFSSGLLALDETEMTYVLTVSLQGEKVQIKMSHISYKYNGENRDRKMLRYTAEDHIADGIVLNKKRTKIYPGYKKFRVKTVDLIDEYEASLKNAFSIQ